MDARPFCKGQVSPVKLPQPMIRGTLIKRYKRFLADVRLESGEVVTAHCANPGAMTGLNTPGLPVYLSRSNNPKRKLSLNFDLVELPTGFVGINTAYPNRIVAEALREKKIAALSAYEKVRPEVRYGEKSRVDFLLSGNDLPDCYLEVKNVHLSRTEGLAEFPDSKTARGARHLSELAEMVKAGHRGINLFLVQRGDCTSFAPAADIDPVYAKALADAEMAGVEILIYACHLTTSEIVLGDPLLKEAG